MEKLEEGEEVKAPTLTEQDERYCYLRAMCNSYNSARWYSSKHAHTFQNCETYYRLHSSEIVTDIEKAFAQKAACGLRPKFELVYYFLKRFEVAMPQKMAVLWSMQSKIPAESVDKSMPAQQSLNKIGKRRK
jgi:hypothetical protein